MKGETEIESIEIRMSNGSKLEIFPKRQMTRWSVVPLTGGLHETVTASISDLFETLQKVRAANNPSLKPE